MVGIQINPIRYQNMRKITAYFMVKQGQNPLLCVGKKAAGYITCTLHKENNLEFALRVKKETKDSVSLYLICGITMEHEKPNYALAGPYIYDYPQEYKDLLSNTFSNPENVSGSTSKSTWNRLKGIDYKNQDGMGLEACLEKIEEIFSWLKDTPKKNCR